MDQGIYLRRRDEVRAKEETSKFDFLFAGRPTSVLVESIAKWVHDHRPSHNSLAWFDSTILSKF